MEYLNLEILYHEPETHQYLLSKSYTQLEEIRNRNPEIVTKVSSVLKDCLRSGNTSIEQVSHAMGITSRTLQYQLKKHDYSYQKVVDEVRIQQVKIYLEDPTLTLLDTALLLGFSEQSTFSKWFKKMFNATPMHYKKALKDK